MTNKPTIGETYRLRDGRRVKIGAVLKRGIGWTVHFFDANYADLCAAEYHTSMALKQFGSEVEEQE